MSGSVLFLATGSLAPGLESIKPASVAPIHSHSIKSLILDMRPARLGTHTHPKEHSMPQTQDIFYARTSVLN